MKGGEGQSNTTEVLLNI